MISTDVMISATIRCHTPHAERGRRVAGGELRHLAGSPGGGGDIRVLSYSN